MADLKISEVRTNNPASALTGVEAFPLVQSAATAGAIISQVLTYVLGDTTTTEKIQDVVAAFATQGTNITIAYDDTANTLTFAVSGLTESVQDIIGALASGGSGLTMTYNDGAGTWVLDVNVDGSTIEISSDALRVKDAGVTLAKMADIATARILGRTTAATGVPEALTPAQARTVMNIMPAVVTLVANATSWAWTNMPAAITGANTANNSNVLLDLANVTQLRMTLRVNTVGFTGSRIGIQYSLDDGTTWKWFTTGNTTYTEGVDGPVVDITIIGNKSTAWANIVTEAKADSVLVRGAGVNGDGIVDPAFGDLTVQFK